ncbi:MAG: hypothetical protein WEB13_12275 [Dehalococcoidia bacterium]
MTTRRTAPAPTIRPSGHTRTLEQTLPPYTVVLHDDDVQSAGVNPGPPTAPADGTAAPRPQ